MANSDTETMVKKAHGMFRDGNLLLAADLCRDTLKIDADNLEALNLLAAVLIGGQVGNFLNLKIFPTRVLALLTAILVIFVAARMCFKIFLI